MFAHFPRCSLSIQKTFANTNEDFVTLVDGASDGEEIPIQPLLVRARKVDTIIAVDAVRACTTLHFRR